MQRYGNSHGERTSLDSHTRAWFDAYSWPGNVRELENLIHRAFVLADGPELRIPVPDSLAICRSDQYVIQGAANDAPQTYAAARMRALESFDREYLADLLRRTRGNVTHAARLAGKERRALGKLLKKYRVDHSQFRA